VNAIIYGKDNPERKPDPIVCRSGVGLTTTPCKKDQVAEMSTIEIVDVLCRDEEDKKTNKKLKQ
jgi:hypothetical protein